MREDTKRALSCCGVSYGSYALEIKEAEKLLNFDEEVFFAAPSTFKYVSEERPKPIRGQCILFLTNSRIVISYRPAFKTKSLIIPLGDVTQFEFLTPIIGIQANLGTASLSFTLTTNLDLAQSIYGVFLEVLENGRLQNDVPLIGSDNPVQNDIPTQIEKLAELKDKGIITEEEFQTKKQDLLSRI